MMSQSSRFLMKTLLPITVLAMAITGCGGGGGGNSLSSGTAQTQGGPFAGGSGAIPRPGANGGYSAVDLFRASFTSSSVNCKVAIDDNYEMVDDSVSSKTIRVPVFPKAEPQGRSFRSTSGLRAIVALSAPGLATDDAEYNGHIISQDPIVQLRGTLRVDLGGRQVSAEISEDLSALSARYVRVANVRVRGEMADGGDASAVVSVSCRVENSRRGFGGGPFSR
jgi:hypothetical protein